MVIYWAVIELGLSGTEVVRRVGVTQPAVSQDVKRKAKIIKERYLQFKGD